MTRTYDLVCQKCSFERTVDGLERSLDAAESHTGEAGTDHFVDMHLVDTEPTTTDDAMGTSGASQPDTESARRSDGNASTVDD